MLTGPGKPEQPKHKKLMRGEDSGADFDDPGNIEDPGSFDFGAVVGNLLKTGQSVVLSKLQPKPQPQQATVSAPAPAKASWVMPALIGGGILVVVLVLGLAFGGKGR